MTYKLFLDPVYELSCYEMLDSIPISNLGNMDHKNLNIPTSSYQTIPNQDYCSNPSARDLDIRNSRDYWSPRSSYLFHIWIEKDPNSIQVQNSSYNKKESNY